MRCSRCGANVVEGDRFKSDAKKCIHLIMSLRFQWWLKIQRHTELRRRTNNI